MAWAIVRCSRDYFQQEAKAAGVGVYSHDCERAWGAPPGPDFWPPGAFWRRSGVL